MLTSLKKASRVLFAMGAGAFVSFGATLALSTPATAEASQVECYAEECNASCVAKGFRLGKCYKAACTCF
ncbi:hypothetical protein EJ065_2028 [Corallococcus coralloides]|uniref:Lipoprotein n=1 Tax=Corallococcus coralloides TaxID=184914 RepID=A0A410RNS3_CORCK|nr:hypothetical protein [Corallococcus coralloides]QAT83614.1 hypothetical protein EJ065_2028 [Corallococcus coralloides]